MITTKSDRWVALSVIACSIVLVSALMLAIGKISFGLSERLVTARFATVTGVATNTTVKYAGAPVGRVKSIRVLPRSASTDKENPQFIEVVISVRQDLDLGDDVSIEIKQDGLLGAKYVALTPGALDAPPLPADKVLSGKTPVELGDLAGPGKELIEGLGPTVKNLEEITAQVRDKLPALTAKLDSVLANGDSLLASVGSPEAKAQIRQALTNIKVVSDNLKVVTTNAKAMTATLGARPWSLIWGGEDQELPTEEEILASDKSVPIPRKAATQSSKPRKP